MRLAAVKERVPQSLTAIGAFQHGFAEIEDVLHRLPGGEEGCGEFLMWLASGAAVDAPTSASPSKAQIAT